MTAANLFADSIVRKLDLELAHGLDVQRVIATTDAARDGVEILEGPPEVEFGYQWKGLPAQIWRYPARRRA